MTHIVSYDGWCQVCKFGKQDEDQYPCDECLSEPVKEDGRRPVFWVCVYGQAPKTECPGKNKACEESCRYYVKPKEKKKNARRS